MSRPIIGYIVDAATRLFTSRKIGGVDFDGTKDINLPGVNEAGNQNTSGNAASATRLQTARKIGGVDFNGTKDIVLPGVNSMGNQSTSGNAASATRLQTGRRINGTTFNGTADIITQQWGNARSIKVGSTTRSVDGSENITWTLEDIGVGTVGRLNTNGKLTNFLRGDGTWVPVDVKDTKYTAGSGLTLNGTEFSLPISLDGTGSFVTGVEQTPTGLRISLGTPPDTNTTYTEVTEAEITAGTSATLRVVTGRRMKFAVDTFGLKLGTTATTAKPGNWVPSWDDVTGKPAVIAAGTTQAAARQVIGAGTSSLTLGTTAGTAKAGNWTPTWSEVTSKPTTFTPAAHNHSAGEITSGVLAYDRIPTIRHGDTNFANQALNTDSNVQHATVRTGGVVDDGTNSLQVGGGTRTDTLAAGGVQVAEESIDTDGNVQIRDEGQLKMGDFAIQYNATTKSLDFNFMGT